MQRAARVTAEKRGRIAERVAVFWLRLQGYRLLEQRFRTKVGEVDLIAEKGGTLIFIEVKRRKSAAAALDAVTYKQRRRIEAAAQLYWQQRATTRTDRVSALPDMHHSAQAKYDAEHRLTLKAKNGSKVWSMLGLKLGLKKQLPHNPGTICRFDVIAIAPWSIPVHIKGAWRTGP